MSGLMPMAVYGLEVPAGDVAITAKPEIPSAFRITMAAIDPSAEPEGDEGVVPRATLKIIRQTLTDYDDEEDYDSEDFDIEDMERMLAEENDDDEEDSEEENVNGGPSDPAKSKAARKAAAQKQIAALLAAEEGMDVDEPNGVTGAKKSAKALGKMPASDEDSEDDDEDSDEDEGEEYEEFVLCTLDPTKNYQQPLDIVVGERERVLFKVSGTHSIYLTGNYVEPAHNHDEEDYDSEDDEDQYDLEPDSDELDDEDDELDALADPRFTENDDQDDEEEAPALIEAKADKKAEKKGKNKRNADELTNGDSSTLDELMKKEQTNGEEKLSKKQLKKLKKNDGTATAAGAEEPASAKSDKKVQFAKELEQGPTPTKDSKKDDKPKASVGEKTVQGVKIDDKKLGTGPAAKKGDRVGMRYIGKLKDGKVFDSNKSGKPFSFKLGSGEVIKGWDIGIAGMSAGGERRITIPAHLAYGKKGSPPVIPGNAELVFDVKLLSIGGK